YLAAASSGHGAVPGVPHAGPAGQGHAAFNGPSWLLVMIGSGIAGAQSVVGEHASGLIRVTLAAVPDRRRVTLAKAVVVASVMAATALVLAGGGLALAAVTAPGSPLAGVDVPSAIGASAVVLPACALAGMAFGALLRHAAPAGFATCAVLGFGPLLLRPDGNRWATDLANTLPYYAWGRLTAAVTGSGGTMTVAVAWFTLAAWAVVSVVITAVVLDRRDV
ncbi:MAG: hypothetical protein ACRDOI_01165, partial [Trebonia sp.]